MAASSLSPFGPSTISRKLVRLILAILFFVALYTAGWFYAASWLQNTIGAFLGHPHNGLTATCPDLKVGGYPFRIGMTCSAVTADLADEGIAVTAAGLRVAGQIYAPWHLVSELDGPFSLRNSDGLNVTANWREAKASLVLGALKAERVSTALDALAATITQPLLAGPLAVSAVHSEAHLRRSGADLDAALLGEGIRASMPTLADLPEMSASLDMTVKDKAGWMDGGHDIAGELRGAGGEIHRLVVDLGEGRVLTLHGPMSLDGEARLSGALSIEVENVEGWRTLLVSRIPEAAPAINTAASALKALSAGKPKASVTLTADHGRLAMGFIHIGDLPPLRP